MNPENRFSELWTDYLEGELDESQFEELRSLLAADPQLLSRAADLYQTHRLLGLLAQDERKTREEFAQEVLNRLPESSEKFSARLMQRLARQLGKHPRNEIRKPYPVRSGRDVSPARWQQILGAGGWLVAAVMLLLSPYLWQDGDLWQDSPSGSKAGHLPEITETDDAKGEAKFVSLAKAQFFGELAPAIPSVPRNDRDYILMNGLVEILYPSGASAIVEGPAVFRVLDDEGLVMNVGRCSVHAPEGAEGFRVETPGTEVVDRGTRFSVQVTETSETEVQVIEGMADIYRKSPDENEKDIDVRKELSGGRIPQNSAVAGLPGRVQEIRLTDRQALRLLKDKTLIAEPAAFNPSHYRHQLPDRIISYSASEDAGGSGVENLLDVTVQRAGKEETYRAEDLILAEVFWFKADPGASRNGHLAWSEDLPEERIQGLADLSLKTGVINPGGNPRPLNSSPILEENSPFGPPTPGMAIRFHRPVINRPGPDILVFEAQPLSGTPAGDAFHLSPVKFAPGRKSLTVKHYDLDMESPAALKVAQFYLFPFEEEAKSLQDLQTFAYQRRPAGGGFRAIAVAIDLSDLGFKAGEEVSELFLQDAGDDDNLVDPVLIGGLP